MKRIVVFAVAALASAAVATAAELPSRRQAKPAEPALKRCQIAGKPGLQSSDGQTCIRFGGYVSGQVSGGNLK